jgi:hypothetical protein
LKIPAFIVSLYYNESPVIRQQRDKTTEQKHTILKKYPTIGVCGFDCGLCPRFYTKGPSRCPGCAGPEFFEKHPSCSFITCAVKKRNLETCGECPEFPCSKFKDEDEYQHMKESSSYPTPKKMMPNLLYIQKHGVKNFINNQKKRIDLLDILIRNFDEGRSRNFFCKATALLDVNSLEECINETTQKIKSDDISANESKIKAGMIRKALNEVALHCGIEIVQKREYQTK